MAPTYSKQVLLTLPSTTFSMLSSVASFYEADSSGEGVLNPLFRFQAPAAELTP